jgi:hypothetical protein
MPESRPSLAAPRPSLHGELDRPALQHEPLIGLCAEPVVAVSVAADCGRPEHDPQTIAGVNWLPETCPEVTNTSRIPFAELVDRGATDESEDAHPVDDWAPEPGSPRRLVVEVNGIVVS